MRKVALVFFIISILSICNLSAQSPDWLWAKKVGGTVEDHGASIAVDGNGNTYITGHFSSNLLNFGDLPPLAHNDGKDIFVAKLDTNGNWLWAKQVGGSGDDMGYCIALDNYGNVYLSGCYNSPSLAFGSLPPLTNSGSYDSDIFVAKLDTNGNWLWAKRAGGANNDYGYDVGVDSNGNSYVTGCFNSPTLTFGNLPPLINSGWYDFDIYVSKLDAIGNWLWARQAVGTYWDEVNSITVDSIGNAYITGYFGSTTLSFGNLPSLTCNSGIDLFVAKLDADGNWLWANQSEQGGEAKSITVDSNGNTYITGLFSSSITFGNLPPLTPNGIYDAFIAKLDTNGSWLWVKQPVGAGDVDDGMSITVDNHDKIYVTGRFDSPMLTFGNLPPLTNNGNYDIFVVKLDTNGSWLWAKQAGGADYDYGYDTSVDNYGNAYVIGDFGSPTLTFDNLPPLYNSWYNDIFVAKLGYENPPTVPVELSSFSAVATDNQQVRIKWATESETQVLGFYVRRADTDYISDSQQINQTLIQATNTSNQHNYEIIDGENLVEGNSYNYWLESIEICGITSLYGPISVTILNNQQENPTPMIPTLTVLLDAFPNPVNASNAATIPYFVKDGGTVKIEICNLKGQVIWSNTHSYDKTGTYHMTWNGKDMIGKSVASGIYFYRMSNGKYSAGKKIVLVK